VTYEEIDNGGPLVNFTQAFNLVGSRTALATDIDDGGGQDDDFQSGRPEQAVRSSGNSHSPRKRKHAVAIQRRLAPCRNRPSVVPAYG
jgi:hypothetical protein